MLLAALGAIIYEACSTIARQWGPSVCPCRYQRGSELCEKLAQSLHHLTTSEERELFDFGKRGGGETAPMIMMLDRKEDPVTPLLLQWTYQAMVHELIGIESNRVDLTQTPGVSLQANLCC